MEETYSDNAAPVELRPNDSIASRRCVACGSTDLRRWRYKEDEFYTCHLCNHTKQVHENDAAATEQNAEQLVDQITKNRPPDPLDPPQEHFVRPAPLFKFCYPPGFTGSEEREIERVRIEADRRFEAAWGNYESYSKAKVLWVQDVALAAASVMGRAGAREGWGANYTWGLFEMFVKAAVSTVRLNWDQTRRYLEFTHIWKDFDDALFADPTRSQAGNENAAGGDRVNVLDPAPQQSDRALIEPGRDSVDPFDLKENREVAISKFRSSKGHNKWEAVADALDVHVADLHAWRRDRSKQKAKIEGKLAHQNADLHVGD